MTSPQLLSDPRSLIEAIFDIERSHVSSSVIIDRIFDNVPAPVIITKPSLQNQWPKILYVNRHFCTLYNYPREALIGSTTQAFSGEATDFSRICEMRDEVNADKVCRVPMTTYNSKGIAQSVRIDISRFALEPDPAVDLWIALHIPRD